LELDLKDDHHVEIIQKYATVFNITGERLIELSKHEQSKMFVVTAVYNGKSDVHAQTLITEQYLGEDKTYQELCSLRGRLGAKEIHNLLLVGENALKSKGNSGKMR
jgi:hypothetical protein